MSRVAKFRPSARRDFVRLANFLADAPPEIAQEMVRRLEARIERLKQFPYLGRPLGRDNLRETTVPYGRSRYVIRYRVTDDAIIVVRAWNSRENR